MTLAMDECQPLVEVKSKTEGFAGRTIFRVGGVAALLAGLLFRRNLGAELSLLKSSGFITAGPAIPPTTAADWFALLQHEPLVGLTWLNVFDLVNYALIGVMFLALFIALKRVNRSGMVLAATLGLIGIVIYFATNQALAMWSLSQQYSVATSEVQRSMLLMSGQRSLALNEFSGPARTVSLLFIAVAGLIASSIMLRSQVFNRATAYVGLIACGSDVAYCLAVAVMPSQDGKQLAIVFIPAAGFFFMLWHILIGQRLYRKKF